MEEFGNNSISASKCGSGSRLSRNWRVYRHSQTPHLPLFPKWIARRRIPAFDTRNESPFGACLPASPGLGELRHSCARRKIQSANGSGYFVTTSGFDDDSQSPPAVKKKRTPCLDDLFPAEDDSELQPMKQRSIPDRVDQEIQVYRGLPRTNMQANTAIWWFGKRDTLPLLYDLAQTYLCVQASSTPSERVFSTAGDTISEERVRLNPEKAELLIDDCCVLSVIVCVVSMFQ
ncbi:uncharacterized protein LOC133654353 [Entelurus aequoreus]|uniref:uncharacterized protein LOC133654353 n=1 Tax=Entelurus aequoreus TaxID=161455 RepID=UPI002B1D76D3|nr:uncharacterized protein LOC133654353 [Entelurus aequoreus]